MTKSFEKREENVTLAIDRDKESQNALRWAVDNLLRRGQTLTLLHVNIKQSSSLPHRSGSDMTKPSNALMEFFLPFHCYCARKDIKCEDVVLEDLSVSKGIIDYVQQNAIETLILGASKKTLLRRFKVADVPSTVIKKAPSFCTIYVISRAKVSSMKSAKCTSPRSSMRQHVHTQTSSLNVERRPQTMARTHDEIEIKSPFMRSGYEGTYQPSMTDSDISFVESGRPSMDRLFPSFYDNLDFPRLSLDHHEYEENRCSFDKISSSEKQFIDLDSSYATTSSRSLESGRQSCSLHSQDETEVEMRRLKMELQYTMDMYRSACKEAISAKKAASELHKWKAEEEHRLEEVRLAKEAAMAIAESEKEKTRSAMEAAMAAQRKAEFDAQKRKYIETYPAKRAIHLGYRKYRIEEIEQATEDFSPSRKIGEGGYGPVYKGTLDYTQVAIKVLRPDAAQGRSQFQREVEVLTCMRHPNMVLLVGACPEYGCLVYEYMANGSLEDCLFRKGNSPILPWPLRFRIAAEIATGLLFLYQMRPEPLVHRDLKPGNILLDKHFVSKISDVGLARLVPPSVADTVTKYRMTSTAGTFYYIDPEYQQTGMLGTKSDIYSFGIMLLQILTGKPPMGLTHYVERAIEKGTFPEMLDPNVPDWPIEEALVAAKLGLHCAQLRRKDRPDLGTLVLPQLNRLRVLGDKNMANTNFGVSQWSSLRTKTQTQSPLSTTTQQEIISDPHVQCGCDSSSVHNSSSS